MVVLYIKYTQMEKQKRFTITKKVAKHGNQTILVIPKVLQEHIRPGTVVEVTLNVIEEVENDRTNSTEWRYKRKTIK